MFSAGDFNIIFLCSVSTLEIESLSPPLIPDDDGDNGNNNT